MNDYEMIEMATDTTIVVGLASGVFKGLQSNKLFLFVAQRSGFRIVMSSNSRWTLFIRLLANFYRGKK